MNAVVDRRRAAGYVLAENDWRLSIGESKCHPAEGDPARRRGPSAFLKLSMIGLPSEGEAGLRG